MNGDKSNSVWILIPAYNAVRWLPELIGKLAGHVSPERIIVIDDGSTDGTAACSQTTGVTVFEHSTNRGKGAALNTGFQYISNHGGQWALTIDADLQHDPDCLPDFLRYAQKNTHDIISGYRRRLETDMPWDRIFSNWSTSLLLSLLTGRRIRDAQCGYRMIRLDILDGISFTTRRYEFETELLLKCIDKGARLAWIPIPTIYGGSSSSINRLTDTLSFLRVVLRHITSKFRRLSPISKLQNDINRV